MPAAIVASMRSFEERELRQKPAQLPGQPQASRQPAQLSHGHLGPPSAAQTEKLTRASSSGEAADRTGAMRAATNSHEIQDSSARSLEAQECSKLHSEAEHSLQRMQGATASLGQDHDRLAVLDRTSPDGSTDVPVGTEHGNSDPGRDGLVSSADAGNLQPSVEVLNVDSVSNGQNTAITKNRCWEK